MEALKLLFISPAGPPKQSAESMQVRRLLSELDQQAQGIWATTPVSNYGWVQADAGLELALQHFYALELKLPLMPWSLRLFKSRFGKCFHVPDSDSWLRLCTQQLVRGLKGHVPDVIYARAMPQSALLLARSVAQKLNRPYVMHLSDPWYRDDGNETSRSLEAICVEDAAAISLTTAGQMALYQARYPHAADKFFVSPNMYPLADELAEVQPQTKAADAPLRLVHAGALYPQRSPQPLIDAVSILQARSPELLAHLQIDFYGNADEVAQKAFKAAPKAIRYHGLVSSIQAKQAQALADVIVTIDVDSALPIHRHYLPSKMLDAMAMHQPSLCVTHEDSTLAQLCRDGYGYAVAPNAPEQLAVQLAQWIEERAAMRGELKFDLPKSFFAEQVAFELMQKLHQVAGDCA